jgi:hypothetical protein
MTFLMGKKWKPALRRRLRGFQAIPRGAKQCLD